ncbi:MAG: MscL family protein, partial [Erysipelotrichaceae bacterium]|nr:MscL family protein [Erysipelotrichaceae bacterium]
MDMAVGIIVGGAFNSVVTALVEDVFTPLINLVTMTPDEGFKLAHLGSTVVSFFITAFCLFLVMKAINTAKKLTE